MLVANAGRTAVKSRVLMTTCMIVGALLGGCRTGRGATDTPATPGSSPTATPAPVVPKPAPAPTPAPPPPAVAPLGINLTTLQYWGKERAFMNLVHGGQWQSATNAGWKGMDPAQINAEGTVLSLKAGEQAVLTLTPPPASYSGDVRVRCTYEGEGELQIFSGHDISRSGRSVEFTWGKRVPISVVIGRTVANDPLRKIDCRESAASKTALFDPAFIETLAPYKVARFLDWQGINFNEGGKWAKRTLPTSSIQVGSEGVAIEHMVSLANEANIDPWMHIHWFADEEYITKFAQYVHDNLEPGRKVYLELSNEVWNFAFPVASSALADGRSMNLGGDDNDKRMRRYAQKHTFAMKIWTRVFADNPSRLVRVLGSQHGYFALTDAAMKFEDTTAFTDAIATAPYFSHGLLTGANANSRDKDALFRELNTDVDTIIAGFAANKAMATKYGKRYITYEAGHHITSAGGNPVLTEMMHDERMYDAYKRYIRGWRKEVGDLMTMFASISPANNNSGWGLAEYSGQPLAETPKRRAVIELANAP